MARIKLEVGETPGDYEKMLKGCIESMSEVHFLSGGFTPVLKGRNCLSLFSVR